MKKVVFLLFVVFCGIQGLSFKGLGESRALKELFGNRIGIPKVFPRGSNPDVPVSCFKVDCRTEGECYQEWGDSSPGFCTECLPSDPTNCTQINEAITCLQARPCLAFSGSVFSRCRYHNCGNCPNPRYPVCEFPSYCAANDTFRFGTCQPQKKEGEACQNGVECSNADYDVDCEDNKCQRDFDSDVGDACVENKDCDETPSVNCSNSVCKGKELGVPCGDSDHCEVGLYCDSNSQVCTPQKKEGESCDPDESGVCGNLVVCSKNGNKCVKVLSVKEGQSCEESEECNAGLLCLETKKCSKPPGAGQKCSVSLECPNGTQCVCNPQTGESTCVTFVFAKRCQKDIENLQECAKKCKEIGTDKDSCASKECGRSAVRNYVECLAETFFFECPNSSIAQTPFVLLILALLLVSFWK